jgi:hypothetical protein
MGVVPVGAQESRPAAEITPYVALGTAGASPVGAAVTIPLTSLFSLETDVAYRHGEGGIHALSLSTSLLYFLPHLGQLSPYLAAGVGLGQYGRPVLGLGIGGGPIGTQSRLAPTVNAGGGLKMPINDSLDLRTDARWFKTIGQGTDQFRVTQGISFDVGKR